MDTSPLQRQQLVRQAVLRDATDILSTTLHLWQCLAQELSAIIGEAGFQSMYLRSQHLSANRFHFLLPTAIDAASSVTTLDATSANVISAAQAGQFAPLLTRLSAQTPATASLASIDLLCTFLDTLALLIGEHLTSTILRSAWGDSALDAKEHHE